MLQNRNIVLGVTGSIAAYKAVDLASKLTQAGALVDVVMTRAATEFVTPLTFQSITGRPVPSDMWDSPTQFEIEHIALAQRAEVVVIAPATANVIAKLAAGIADDLLCCTVLATRAPVIVAPVMNVNMYENQVTQANLERLASRGFAIVDPEYGPMACGAVGRGRLADTETILAAVERALRRGEDLAGKRVVVTAGGTQEPIDPVRHITNRSSGKMGYALAEAARDRGADVVLISAPTALTLPAGMRTIRTVTALEMRDAVLVEAPAADALVMAAAVADYRPAAPSDAKLKKGGSSGLVLKLTRNPDILSEARGDFVKVGFAAETEDLIRNAAAKLKEKDLDLIVGNDVAATDSGFDTDTNRVTIIDRSGNREDLPLMSKRDVAHKVIDRVVEALAARTDRERRGSGGYASPGAGQPGGGG